MVDETFESFVFDDGGQSNRQLSCANCNEPLPLEESGNTLTCRVCGQGHRSLAPPPPVYREDFGIGDLVAVMRGERWWAAHVVEVVGSDHWRIHYDGWGPAYDEVVDICRVRPIDYVPGSSIIPPAFEPKMKVKRAGLVPAMGILFVLLTAVGFLLSWTLGNRPYGQETGSPSGMESAAFGAITDRVPGIAPSADHFIEEGQSVYVSWGNAWYRGTVLMTDGLDRFLIQYDSWDNSQNEIVTRDRLRLIP
jgi:hypothetical protein